MAEEEGRRKGHPLLVVLIVVLVLVCVVGGYALALMNSAKHVQGYAHAMVSTVQDLEDSVNDGDFSMSMITASAQQLTTSASQLHDETDGWLWQVATYIPVYGQDATAVRTLGTVADDLCANVVTPVVGALPAGGLDGLDLLSALDTVSSLGSLLPSVTDAVNDAAAKVDGIGELHVQQLADAVTTIRSGLDEAASTLNEANDSLDALTALLGM